MTIINNVRTTVSPSGVRQRVMHMSQSRSNVYNFQYHGFATPVVRLQVNYHGLSDPGSTSLLVEWELYLRCPCLHRFYAIRTLVRG